MATIDRIVGVKERIKGNMSSKNMIDILDSLIHCAVHPLMLHTSLHKSWACEILAFILLDSRSKRKITNSSADDQLDLLFTMVVGETREDQFRAFTLLRLDRGLAFHFVHCITSFSREYAKLQASLVAFNRQPAKQRNSILGLNKEQDILFRLTNIENSLGGSREHLEPVLRLSAWYIEQARIFKAMIAEKFYRMVNKEAHKSEYDTRVTVDQDDLFQNFLLALDKTINKYDPNKGTLQPYIAQWLKNAKTNSPFDHQFGYSYKLPSTRRRLLQKNNWVNSQGQAEQNLSVTLDEVTENFLTVEGESVNELEMIKDLAPLVLDMDMRLVLLQSGIDFPVRHYRINTVNKR